MSRHSRAAIYTDTIVAPSFTSAIAQIVQIPGISGMDNNSVLFEFHEDDPGELPEILNGCRFAEIMDYNISILRSSERHFGYKRDIHIWLNAGDYRNAGFMILLSYILMDHPEWNDCTVTLFAAFGRDELDTEVEKLNRLIDQGRIPISHSNVEKVPWDKTTRRYEDIVCEHSEEADLVIMGFSLQKALKEGGAFFKQFTRIKDLLFVRAGQKIMITEE